MINDTVPITVMVVSVLQPNTTFVLIECSYMKEKACVCNHYSRQDCPTENTETIIITVVYDHVYGLLIIVYA